MGKLIRFSEISQSSENFTMYKSFIYITLFKEALRKHLINNMNEYNNIIRRRPNSSSKGREVKADAIRILKIQTVKT